MEHIQEQDGIDRRPGQQWDLRRPTLDGSAPLAKY